MRARPEFRVSLSEPSRTLRNCQASKVQGKSGPRCLRRARDERGAALVETALILPLFFMLLLGTVSAAIAYGQSSSITNATRESSRFGATLTVDGDLSAWLASTANAAEGAAIGDVDVMKDGHNVCVAYVYPNGTELQDRTRSLTVDKNGATEGPAPCYADGRPNKERRVQVVIERPATIETGFWSNDLTLSAQAASIFERATS